MNEQFKQQKFVSKMIPCLFLLMYLHIWYAIFMMIVLCQAQTTPFIAVKQILSLQYVSTCHSLLCACRVRKNNNKQVFRKQMMFKKLINSYIKHIQSSW